MRVYPTTWAVLAAALLLAVSAPASAAPSAAPQAACSTSAGGTVLAVAAREVCAPTAEASAAAAAAAPCAPLTNEARCTAWEATYDGAASGADGVGGLVSHRMVAISPDGATVYTAGPSDVATGADQNLELLVLALDATTGAQRWAVTIAGEPAFPVSEAMGIVVSPDGRTVVATAGLYRPDASGGMTVALDAATGAVRWRVVDEETFPNALAMDPGGRYAFVVGGRFGEGTNDAVTAAYGLQSGDVAWLHRYTGTTERSSGWRAVASPDGTRLYVAVAGLTGGTTTDVVLLVYEAAAGGLLTDTHHPTKGFPPAGIDVSADGSRVVISEANSETSLNTALTLAYDRDGSKLWTARFAGCDQFKCSARPWYSGPVSVSGDGARVFVTSLGVLVGGGTVFHTTAYDGTSGAQLWTVAHPWNAGDCFCGPSVGVTPDGETVVISGYFHFSLFGGDATTVAYDAATGARRWTATIAEVAGNVGTGQLAMTPDGTRVVVAGGRSSVLADGDNIVDVLLAAYDVRP